MFNKITYALLAIALLFISTSAISGDKQPVVKSKYDSYIVVMNLQPAISYEGNITGYEATKPAKGKKINAKSLKVKKYENKLKKEHDTLLTDFGLQGNKVNDYTMAINGFSVRMTYAQAQKLALSKNVARVIPDELHQKMTDSSPAFLGLNDKKGPWDKGITGEDVIIGVIDSGIWPEHPSFADDGSYSDLGLVLDDTSFPSCDFGNTAHKPEDAPFTCNNKLLGARQVLPTYRFLVGAESYEYDSARDSDGHGSHTASTAGGNANVPAEMLGSDFGLVSGIAPRARIIAYKALGDLGGFSSDLAAAIDQAVADGVDVINYSIGGGCCTIGPDDIAFLFAADAGVFVATSNGNSGPAPGTTGSPAVVPWLTSVGASTQDRTYEGSAESSDGWEFFGASITGGTAELPLIDAADAGDELCRLGWLDPTAVSGKIVLCKRGSNDRIEKSLAVWTAGGAGMILYNQFDAQAQATDSHCVPSVHINNTDGLVIKGYILSAPAAVAQINGGVFTTIDAPWMAAFSSRGPNGLSGDIIKPDVTAPGVNILAGNSPDAQGEFFQMISGTSMSSPHVAGLFALIKQAHPDWSPAMAKSALMTSSYQDVMKEDGVTPADAFDMGAGHVSPGGDINSKGSLFNPGLVYDAGLFEYAGFTCGADLGVFSAGTCAFLESIGVPLDPSNLNLPSIGIDELVVSETVYRTVTMLPTKSMKSKTYYVSVEAPPGFEVVVTPDKLKLKGGESATYAVTITHVDAAFGEWEHGSLAWSTKKAKSTKKSKKNKKSKTPSDLVYSPIAVRAVPLPYFTAPDSLSGSGESGSASFDVRFGFTGDYIAFAHGLVPANVVVDNVMQDPDQSFDPLDGFSDAHVITVTGGLVLRIALPPEATDPEVDLDLYLFDPSGNFVDGSFNEGTDELVEVILPADGDWTLYVHGWDTVNPTADYSLYSWVIPAAPGGSLSIDAAPTSATYGSTEPINISWTGATASQWHFGAVTHVDAGGLFYGTLVEVDNR